MDSNYCLSHAGLCISQNIAVFCKESGISLSVPSKSWINSKRNSWWHHFAWIMIMAYTYTMSLFLPEHIHFHCFIQSSQWLCEERRNIFVYIYLGGSWPLRRRSNWHVHTDRSLVWSLFPSVLTDQGQPGSGLSLLLKKYSFVFMSFVLTSPSEPCK